MCVVRFASRFEVCLLSVGAAGVDVENPSSLSTEGVVSSKTGGGKSWRLLSDNLLSPPNQFQGRKSVKDIVKI